MNLKLILVPTDFSPYSEAALRLATVLARDSAARLLVVHVAEPRPAYTVAGIYASLPAGNEFAVENEQLQRIVPPDPQVLCEKRFLVGSPAEEIVGCAAAEGADMIVMGTHGRTGLLRLLLGSVAESILRQAPCPVLTVKSAAQPNAATS
ncbi:MAG: universal stress protein [Pirellulales bacterium]